MSKMLSVLVLSVVALAGAARAQESKPAADVKLPGNLRPLAEAAGLTPEEAGGVAAALRDFEDGRRAVEKRVQEADQAWVAATKASDDAAAQKAAADVKLAKADRVRYYDDKAVDLSKLMPAEKYALWVSADLDLAVARELSRANVKLSPEQAKTLTELAKAEAPKMVGAGSSASAKQSKGAILAQLYAKTLTAEQRAAVDASPVGKQWSLTPAPVEDKMTTQPAKP